MIGNAIGIGFNRPNNKQLLDKISGAIAAYSLRKLRSTAVKCIRVRRSSDNSEQDIGFVGSNLDTASLLAFIGAGSGYVTKWYDQSGYGNELIQTTASLQPLIVSSGAYLGYVTLDSSDDRIACMALNNTGFPQSEFSVYMASIPYGTGTDVGLFSKYYNNANAPFFKLGSSNVVNYRLGYTSGTYNSYTCPINTIVPNQINNYLMAVKTGIGGSVTYITNNDIHNNSIANTSWVPNQTDFTFYNAIGGISVGHKDIVVFNRKITEDEYTLLAKK